MLIYDKGNPASSISENFSIACGNTTFNGQVDCPSLSQEYLRLNQAFCSARANGKFELLYDSMGVLNGSATSADVVYFSVSARNFNKVRLWYPVALSGKGIVINVRGASAKFAQSSMGMLYENRNSTVWNFVGPRS